MPAEIVTMADCASNYGIFEVAGSAGKTYKVTYQGSQLGPHCTCEGFRYRRDCRHARFVWENACLWNPQWHDGREDPAARPVGYTYDAIIPGEACPACGGPVVAVRRAV